MRRGSLGAGVGKAAYAAEQGATTGVASFHAKGEAKNYKCGVTVWDGTFVGVSVTDARKGPLQNSGWDCTGEVVMQDGNSYSANGFCLVTDPDGDTINLRWVRTNVPGPVAEPKTKGTYLAGTGKYSNIQGYYICLSASRDRLHRHGRRMQDPVIEKDAQPAVQPGPQTASAAPLFAGRLTAFR